MASNNASAHADVLAESIIHNESQGDMNDLMENQTTQLHLHLAQILNKVMMSTLQQTSQTICTYLMNPESVLEGEYIKCPES